MSIPPGTPSAGEGEGSSLKKKKNGPLCRLGWAFKLLNFFNRKISEMGFGARRGVRENGLLVLIHGE